MIIREYRGALYRKELTISSELYSEMKTYQYDKNNRPNAIAPNHDDLLMADMIAYYGLQHEPFVAKHQKPKIDVEMLNPYQRHMHNLRNQRQGDAEYDD